ncbi:isochorismatase family protein [Nocardiopsis sp. L17-MgMaSL7]|uniref:isochorismatase family protein n=1 Tax=Nocardiopsis sp. L17-MgMaSL7 TaxID=1938893 RepID=UPI000D71D778|nr:isochorismatase family protein [Nocardiopsis sp. L17-MgMaSL7]PWV50256.1 nicotinamidase-related amidase [Nocardiopsis sp. L17-MgMaSL7]
MSTEIRTGAALLVVDAQRSFLQRESWSASSDPEVAVRIGRLVDHFRERGRRVVWVMHTEPGTGSVFDPVRGFVEPLPGLAPTAGETRLTKTAHSAFTGTDLRRLLTGWGVREVTVCGVRTEQCCETTTRMGSELGFAMTFAVDATATEPIEAPGAAPGRSLREVLDDPATLLPRDVVTRTVYALSGRFAEVRTVDQIVTGKLE